MNFKRKQEMKRIFETPSDIRKIVESQPDANKIVYTYGVWDLLHPGHIKLLQRAKELGDFLIVGVVADAPVSKLKGKNRPVQKIHDRLYIVGSLRCVDAVLAQPEYDPSFELQSIKRIDILTKGDDWNIIPGSATVEKLGGQLIKLNYSTDYSTSKFVSKISGKRQKISGEPQC